MPRRNRPTRTRIQTAKVSRIDALIVKALASLPGATVTTGGGK